MPAGLRALSGDCASRRRPSSSPSLCSRRCPGELSQPPPPTPLLLPVPHFTARGSGRRPRSRLPRAWPGPGRGGGAGVRGPLPRNAGTNEIRSGRRGGGIRSWGWWSRGGGEHGPAPRGSERRDGRPAAEEGERSALRSRPVRGRHAGLVPAPRALRWGRPGESGEVFWGRPAERRGEGGREARRQVAPKLCRGKKKKKGGDHIFPLGARCLPWDVCNGPL